MLLDLDRDLEWILCRFLFFIFTLQISILSLTFEKITDENSFFIKIGDCFYYEFVSKKYQKDPVIYIHERASGFWISVGLFNIFKQMPLK